MKKTYKIFLVTVLLVSFFASTAFAELYKLSLTRISQDLYKDDISGYYFKTRYCYEYAYSEEVIFDSDEMIVIFVNSRSEYAVDRLLR